MEETEIKDKHAKGNYTFTLNHSNKFDNFYIIENI